tara:strand:- start:4804 stop:4974 length:171 start_codon:yes stop_codon:yes gene_type:complete
MNKCECKSKEKLKEKEKELENRFEQSKSATAFLQGQLMLIKELIKCACEEECDCQK